MKKLAGLLLYSAFTAQAQAPTLGPTEAVNAIVNLEKSTGIASRHDLLNFINRAMSQTFPSDPSRIGWSREVLTESIKTPRDAQSMIANLRTYIDTESNDPDLKAAAKKILSQQLDLTPMGSTSVPSQEDQIFGSRGKTRLAVKGVSQTGPGVPNLGPTVRVVNSNEVLIEIRALRIGGRDVELYEYLQNFGLLTSGIPCGSFSNRNCRISLMQHAQMKPHASRVRHVKIVLRNPDDFIRTYNSQRSRRSAKVDSSTPSGNTKTTERADRESFLDDDSADCEQKTCYSDKDTSFVWDCKNIEVEVSSNGEVSVSVNLFKFHH